MESHNLYFIAIVFPDELSKEVVKIQSEIADRFQSYKSLKNVPHITLKAPFRRPGFVHNYVLDWFSNLVVSIPSFHLELEDYDAFQNPKHPVIYIKPRPNEALAKLQKLIIQEFYRTFEDVEIGAAELIFQPHVTIAYRDLRPDLFDSVWAEFKGRKFSGSFQASTFQLLKHDGERWHVIRNYVLK